MKVTGNWACVFWVSIHLQTFYDTRHIQSACCHNRTRVVGFLKQRAVRLGHAADEAIYFAEKHIAVCFYAMLRESCKFFFLLTRILQMLIGQQNLANLFAECKIPIWLTRISLLDLKQSVTRVIRPTPKQSITWSISNRVVTDVSNKFKKSEPFACFYCSFHLNPRAVLLKSHRTGSIRNIRK